MKLFKDRLKKVIDYKYNGKWTILAKEAKISTGSFKRYLDGICKPGFDQILRICEVTNVNPSWLLTGEGPMFKGEEEEKSYLSEEEYVYLPLLEGGVTAGPNGGILYEKPDDMYPFKKSWIELKFGKSPDRHKALVLVRVQGDSMIPTIYPGEVVLVDTWEHDRVYVRNGKIYMIRMPDGGITLKRVVLSEKGKIVCISDNPNYEPFEFTIEEGKTLLWYLLGRIRWVGREID